MNISESLKKVLYVTTVSNIWCQNIRISLLQLIFCVVLVDTLSRALNPWVCCVQTWCLSTILATRMSGRQILIMLQKLRLFPVILINSVNALISVRVQFKSFVKIWLWHVKFQKFQRKHCGKFSGKFTQLAEKFTQPLVATILTSGCVFCNVLSKW